MRAGYIIGRGVRIVEWDVAEHPDKPDGDLMSMKLRALTPDGIRMAIAKAYGLSNYREVELFSCLQDPLVFAAVTTVSAHIKGCSAHAADMKVSQSLSRVYGYKVRASS